MKNVGTIFIIALLAWLLFKGQKQAAASASATTTPATTVPITGYATKEIPVFGSIEELNAATGVS
jgi:hypothetical protein